MFDNIKLIRYNFTDIKISNIEGGVEMSNEKLSNIPVASLERIPIYLSVLQSLSQKGTEFISSNAIAELVNENASVVKKDLSYLISKEGKPKIGYDIKSLIADIENILISTNVQDAIIVGVGKLGSALFHFNGFKEYGFNIKYGFDTNSSIIGTKINGKKIYDISELSRKVKEKHIKIGIITTPSLYAQETAEKLIESGIKAIWNFTSSHLEVPKNIVVKNENLATSLAILSKQLQETFKED